MKSSLSFEGAKILLFGVSCNCNLKKGVCAHLVVVASAMNPEERALSKPEFLMRREIALHADFQRILAGGARELSYVAIYNNLYYLALEADLTSLVGRVLERIQITLQAEIWQTFADVDVTHRRLLIISSVGLALKAARPNWWRPNWWKERQLQRPEPRHPNEWQRRLSGLLRSELQLHRPHLLAELRRRSLALAARFDITTLRGEGNR